MLQTSLRGGVAGAVAAAVMTLEQPLDKRLFDSKYDDVEILGKLFTRKELAQDLDVVVLGVEEAFVEWLLERHHRRRDRARNPPSQTRLQHWSSMSGSARCYNRRR